MLVYIFVIFNIFVFFCFFFNDTATTEIYTLSLHDALPISRLKELTKEIREVAVWQENNSGRLWQEDPNSLIDDDTILEKYMRFKSPQGLQSFLDRKKIPVIKRSEEHTSELQSPCNLVCRLLLEKKK